MIGTLEELKALCEEWQRLLRLQPWEIDIRIARGYDLGDSQADVNFVTKTQMAIIRLLDPADWEPSRQGEQDHEVSLVHELLHLRFADVGAHMTNDGSTSDLLEEQAVNALSKALVDLRRKLVEATNRGPAD